MKKILALILSLVMAFSWAVPVVNAATEKTAVVYLEGYGSWLFDENGEQIFPVELDIIGGITEVFDEMTLDLIMGKLTGNYDDYSEKMYNLFAPAFAEIKLDKNGEATDENGIYYFGTGSNPVTYVHHSNDRYDYGYYRFHYDWRLSCEYNAELLADFVENVLASSGADKVSLVGRCLGGNIISAFLENAPEETLSKVDDAVLYIPSTLGVDFIGALFSGNIVLDSNAIDNYVEYSLSGNDILASGGSGDLFEILTVTVNFLNEVYILGFTADEIEKIYEDVKGDTLARILRDSFATFPSFWSMVPAESVEEGIEFIFPTDELKTEYAGLITKIRSYHRNVQLKAEETTKRLSENGMDIMIISKYNFPDFPVSENAMRQSDSTAATFRTSFGATTSDFGNILDKKYTDSVSQENRKYLSADNMIDASTCALPDNTWFIKNLYHDEFPASVDRLINKFIFTENATVNTFAEYPQFLNYDKETDSLSPVTGLDDGDIIVKGTVTSKLASFMKFMNLVIDIIKKVVSGEIDLGALLG